VKLRQRLGFVVMILFLPINGPLWRMGMEALGRPIPFGDLHFFGVSVFLFIIGAVMALTPEISFGYGR
jgi:hypothetical protein